ncbi:hypothetical protein GOV10_03150, partial [Candidatus Woesearchaeota archaeon]|nr:hypothetical protein [Candidatus Woesearchaeota archaeon]
MALSGEELARLSEKSVVDERLAKAFSEQGRVSRAASLSASASAKREVVDKQLAVVRDLENAYSSDKSVSYNSFLDRRSNEKTVSSYDPTEVVKNLDGSVTFNRYAPYNYSEGRTRVRRKPTIVETQTYDSAGQLVSAKSYFLGTTNKYGQQAPLLLSEETPTTKTTNWIDKDDGEHRIRETTIIDKSTGESVVKKVATIEPRVPKYQEKQPFVQSGPSVLYSAPSHETQKDAAVSQRTRFVASGQSKTASPAEVVAAQRKLVASGESSLTDSVSGRPVGVVGSLAFAVRQPVSEPSGPSVLEEGIVLSRRDSKKSVLVWEGSAPRDASEAFARLGYP